MHGNAEAGSIKRVSFFLHPQSCRALKHPLRRNVVAKAISDALVRPRRVRGGRNRRNRNRVEFISLRREDRRLFNDKAYLSDSPSTTQLKLTSIKLTIQKTHECCVHENHKLQEVRVIDFNCLQFINFTTGACAGLGARLDVIAGEMRGETSEGGTI